MLRLLEVSGNYKIYPKGANIPKPENKFTFGFDRRALRARGLKYERLDQLTVELLLGVR